MATFRACLVLALFLWLFAAVAHAHGGRPQSQYLAFHPTDENTWVVQATFGLVVTTDGGENWDWICMEAIPGGRPGFPVPMVLTADSTLWLATAQGLSKGSSLGCEWSAGPEVMAGSFVSDVIMPEEGLMYAVRSDGLSANGVHRSTDAGATWESVGEDFPSGFLPERVRVDPTDAMRIYLGGVYPATEADPRRLVVFVSEDGGTTWTERPVAHDEEEESSLILLDVTDEGELFARIIGEEHDRLIVTRDGAGSFEDVVELTALAMPVGRPFGFAQAPPEGETAGAPWYGNTMAGLLRGTDVREAIDKDLLVACVVEHQGDMWLCGDGFTNGYSVARTSPVTYEPEILLTFDDIAQIRSCGGEVERICERWWPDLLIEIGRGDELPDAGVPDGGLDASVPADAGGMIDGGVRVDSGVAGPTRGAGAGGGGCSCDSAGERTSGGGLFALLVLGWLMRRRRG